MKNADVPMLYNNICRRPPTNETPARASFTPNDAAAPLECVEEALPEVPVLVPVPVTPLVASGVVKQVKRPWMMLPCSALKPEQSILVVDCMLKPPLTLLRDLS